MLLEMMLSVSVWSAGLGFDARGSMDSIVVVIGGGDQETTRGAQCFRGEHEGFCETAENLHLPAFFKLPNRSARF